MDEVQADAKRQGADVDPTVAVIAMLQATRIDSLLAPHAMKGETQIRCQHMSGHLRWKAMAGASSPDQKRNPVAVHVPKPRPVAQRSFIVPAPKSSPADAQKAFL